MTFFILLFCLSLSISNLNCAQADSNGKAELELANFDTSKLSDDDKANIVVAIYSSSLEELYGDSASNLLAIDSSTDSAFETIKNDKIKELLKEFLSISSKKKELGKFAKKLYNQLTDKVKNEKFGMLHMMIYQFIKKAK